MEQLLEMAKSLCDSAEVFSFDSRRDGISFENASLKDIDSSMQSGVCLRIIKDNLLGFACTRNLTDRSALIQNAIDSLRGGVDANFEFPDTAGLAALETYDPSIETLTNSVMVGECGRVCELLSGRTKAQINATAHRSTSGIRIMNTSGTCLSLKSSAFYLGMHILYPYTSASLHRTLVSKRFEEASDEYLDFLADTYGQSMKEVKPASEKLKVIFLPETLYVFLWRLQSATSGHSIYQKISPVAGKLEEKLFDGSISIFNDPLNDSLPGARAFDDEGTPCARFPIVERGVLKNFYYDLYFAAKMKTTPTGHGFKSSISGKPVPSLNRLTIIPGDKSFADLVQSVDRGIIVAGALGAHSGNIPNGDFSIGVSPALYVEKGGITGHLKDVMVAGNIYDILKKVAGVENTLHPSSGGNLPAVLFDNISVTVKK